MSEHILYEIIDPDGKEWETENERDALMALRMESVVFENKKIISHAGVTFTRLTTITQLSLDHFNKRNFYHVDND